MAKKKKIPIGGKSLEGRVNKKIRALCEALKRCEQLGEPAMAVKALAFCRRIAAFLKDCEQTQERTAEGLDPFVLENDDAVECLHDCIDDAREITGEAPHLV